MEISPNLKSMQKRCIRFCKLFVSAFYLLSNLTEASQCFANQRFPKVIQSATTKVDGTGTAIIVHEGLNALFVGGEIWQIDDFIDNGVSQPWAHIGRIELSNNMWSWSKKVTF